MDLYRFDIRPPDKIPSFAITVSLSAAAFAYMCEVFRAGLASIPRQYLPRQYLEAARAIGLTFTQRLLWVILPQAVRRAVPPWINTAAAGSRRARSPAASRRAPAAQSSSRSARLRRSLR